MSDDTNGRGTPEPNRLYQILTDDQVEAILIRLDKVETYEELAPYLPCPATRAYLDRSSGSFKALWAFANPVNADDWRIVRFAEVAKSIADILPGDDNLPELPESEFVGENAIVDLDDPAVIDHLQMIIKEAPADLPVEDHPFALMLPTWDHPGILRLAQPSQEFPRCNVRAYNFMPANLRQTLALAEGAPDPLVHVGPGTINNVTFARAIAKIAYCHAVARHGLDGFRPLVVPDIILGKYPNVPYFVGSDPDEPPPPHPGNVRHAVEIATATSQGGQRLLVATVRLFANSGTKEHGMPIYRVVTGAPLL